MFVYFVLLFQSLIASGTHIIAKVVVRDIDPLTLTMLRSSIAAVVLVGILFIRKEKVKIEKEHFKTIIWLSFLAIPINQFLFLTAIKHTTASNAAIFYGTTPAVVLIISYFLGLEQLTFKKTLGVIIAFCGISLIVFERGIDLHSDYTFGNLLLVIAVIAWAFYTVHGRPMILKYGAFFTSAITMVLGTIFYLPIGIINTLRFDYSTLTVAHWGGMFYLAIGTSIFAYFLWYYALGRVEASKVAIFANLQPVLTTILAVILLGQNITAGFVVGGIVALSGIIITQFG
jgi:drug/metabolite transporter (DMT)-like permease